MHTGKMEELPRESKLLRWPIFSLLDTNLLQNVKLACVFGSAGNEAILVTRDDEILALGANDNSCLGIGDAKSSLLPRKVEQLCKKGERAFDIVLTMWNLQIRQDREKLLLYST